MPACSSARSSAKSSGAAGAFSGSSSTVGRARLQRLGDLLLGRADRLGDLGVRGQASLAGADLDLSAADARGQLDDAARGVRTSCVRSRRWWRISPSMAGTATARRSRAARRLEAVDGLDEADGADLHEVVDGLASACVAARYGAHEAHVLLDEARSRLLMPPRHDSKVSGQIARVWVNFRPVSPWFHRWLQGSRAPLGGMK